MTMTMREKMARAMLERYASINGYVVPSILPQTKLAWHLEMADAALDALLVPTDDVVSEGYNAAYAADTGVDEIAEVVVENSYVAMIRAIKEGK